MHLLKRMFLLLWLIILSLMLGSTFALAQEKGYPNLLKTKELVITRGYSKDALKCIECHAKKTPGIVESWRESRMAHAGVSCYDCHAVPKSSPMASQCEGVKGTKIFTSPMVSPKTCSKCHPKEVEQFSKSGHAKLASAPVVEKAKFKKLMYDLEGGKFAGVPENSKLRLAARQSGCQMCHGTEVKLNADKKPTDDSWPAGIGTRYPDGGIGNCVVCHNRHSFKISEARKPEACAKCHIGPDHPNIEIYYESNHGQLFLTEGEEWRWDSAPDTWEPGDYKAPTCAVCHMSGIGELATTHNVNERLKWDLVHPKSVVRSGERGDGEKGRQLMRKVCSNCHSSVHSNSHFAKLDRAVDLYNFYYDGASKMLAELKAKNLLKEDKWKDAFQELNYYLWHHTGRRARHGAAMAGPDYAHWHGFFQIFQIYKDMQDIFDYRIKNNKIEELSPVMSTGPY
ncbi:cytochrome c3 family protein [Desulfohalobiaceae bacterium Ax17]|uniref:multiheme c-type cytochrome n=1 Tax=Desulfovulcanus ferrireducens TaxID=2831190 RepID=UPI00207BA471|nr:multiheme c-type cytochrome [Desulfovulcanus ferrireducens]MBT8764309.1 cytochrome c3 family protein [Desulfovulcanus ferrireducens]